MSILVSPQQLNDALHQGKRITVLASVWEPREEDAFNLFSSLHIPTAQFAYTSGAFAGLPGSRDGRNPLPDVDKLQEWIDRWGLREDRTVVLYDEGRGLFAGRGWWTLRWAGVKDVRILDGGLANWRKQGLPTLTGPGNFAVDATITARAGAMPTATIDDVKAHTGLLIDAREPNRFAGLTENLDLKAGHIPGAVNFAERHLHDPNTRVWKSPEEIRALAAEIGLTADTAADAIIYSGSGNHSSLAIAALEYAGITRLRHYVGGWSQWSANPANPVAR